jgi:hypothetical protein
VWLLKASKEKLSSTGKTELLLKDVKHDLIIELPMCKFLGREQLEMRLKL